MSYRLLSHQVFKLVNVLEFVYVVVILVAVETGIIFEVLKNVLTAVIVVVFVVVLFVDILVVPYQEYPFLECLLLL